MEVLTILGFGREFMEQRHDIHGPVRTPCHMREFLFAFGGTNPHGEPMYRLELAQQVFTLEAGDEIVEWREGSTLAERGGFITVANEFGEPIQIASGERPRRTTRGMRWVPKYPMDVRGWILERWFPEESSKADWHAPANCMKDGTPLLGPYPDFGKYLWVAGPCGEIPSQLELEGIIDRANYNAEAQLALRRLSIDQRVSRLKVRLAQELIAELRRKQAITEQLQEHFSFMGGSSLEAGRLREDLAKSIRARGGEIGHVGN